MYATYLVLPTICFFILGSDGMQFRLNHVRSFDSSRPDPLTKVNSCPNWKEKLLVNLVVQYLKRVR